MTSGYFNRFPYLAYDLSGDPKNNSVMTKNIFFRFHIMDSALSNSLVYYNYYVNDHEKPDTIAYKYYGDSTKHWVIMMANKIVDPFYDWPLSYNDFVNHLISKYGSVENAQTTIYAYKLNIQKLDSSTGNITNNLITIDENTYANTAQFEFETVNLQDGTSVEITTTTSIQYAYDYELELNEQRRNIIIIDKKYIDQIDNEFTKLIKGK